MDLMKTGGVPTSSCITVRLPCKERLSTADKLFLQSSPAEFPSWPNHEKSIAFFEAIGFRQVGGDKELSLYIPYRWMRRDRLVENQDRPVEFDRKTNVGLHPLALKARRKRLGQCVELQLEGVEKGKLSKAIIGVYDPSGTCIEFTFTREVPKTRAERPQRTQCIPSL